MSVKIWYILYVSQALASRTIVNIQKYNPAGATREAQLCLSESPCFQSRVKDNTLSYLIACDGTELHSRLTEVPSSPVGLLQQELSSPNRNFTCELENTLTRI